MSTHLAMSTLLVLLVCMLTESARELCFKRAADGVAFAAALRHPLTWLGIVFWMVEITTWVMVLQDAPLSIAFPLMSLVYVLVTIAGATLLKEKVTKQHLIGALFITAGVACVGATGL